MARILFSRRPSTSMHRRPAAADAAPCAAEPRAKVGTEHRRGPGWFDSSWDLRAGLEVCEGWPADVRLDEWVTGFCGTDAHHGVALQAA